MTVGRIASTRNASSAGVDIIANAGYGGRVDGEVGGDDSVDGLVRGLGGHGGERKRGMEAEDEDEDGECGEGAKSE